MSNIVCRKDEKFIIPRINPAPINIGHNSSSGGGSQSGLETGLEIDMVDRPEVDLMNRPLTPN